MKWWQQGQSRHAWPDAVVFDIVGDEVVDVSANVSWVLGGSAVEWVGLDVDDLVRPSARRLPSGDRVHHAWIEDVYGLEHRAAICVGPSPHARGWALVVRVDDARAVQVRRRRTAAVETAVTLCDGVRRHRPREDHRSPGPRLAVVLVGAASDIASTSGGDDSIAHALAEACATCVRFEDPIEVSGSDEIVVALDGLHGEAEARRIAERLAARLKAAVDPELTTQALTPRVSVTLREGLEGAEGIVDRLSVEPWPSSDRMAPVTRAHSGRRRP